MGNETVIENTKFLVDMTSRRTFIQQLGTGAALSSIALPTTAASLVAGINKQGSTTEKRIRIGIIGAENSHSWGFGRLFNQQKKFPGAEVLYIWGETDEFAKNAAEKGSIPTIVKDPSEMMGKIDALIVDHRHAKYHLAAATPFVKEGIPTFVDKPFCYRVEEGKEFLAMARQVGTPVTSFSSIAHSAATFDIKEQVAAMNDINQVVRYGPVELDSKYGGVFFYGVHLVQPLMVMFGEDIERVRVTSNGNKGTASINFSSGLIATLVFKNVSRGWDTFVETKDGLVELKSRVEESDPALNYVDMVEMFRTGKEPRSHESILKCVAVLEALEKSVKSQDWEKVIV